MSAAQRVLVLLGDPRLADAVKRGGKFNEEDLDTVARLKAALAELPEWAFSFHDDHGGLMEELAALADTAGDGGALALNLCDEGLGNNPHHELHLPAMLEALHIPYTGAGPACLGLCYNKAHVNAIAAALGVPVPRELRLGRAEPDAIERAARQIGYPVIVKPECGDGSMGIGVEAVLHSARDIGAACARLEQQGIFGGVLVEEFLQGQEYLAGLVGNPGQGFELLPVLEVDYSALAPGRPPLLCYESKWEPESDYWNDIRFPVAQIEEQQRTQLRRWSELLFERLGCRDYARMDFRADAAGNIKLLEVNPNPGWCWDGKLAIMAAHAGWSYPELLRRILLAAKARY